MYAQPQPIVIKQTAPRRSYKRKATSSKYYKKYKRAYYNARRYRKYIQDQVGPRGQPDSIARWGADWASATPDQQALRRGTGFRGKGDYRDMLRSGSRGLGETIGSYFGYGDKGRGLGGDFSRWMGWGEYGGDAGGNSIMAGSTSVPMTVNASDDLTGDVYFANREFLGNVTALATGSTTPSAFNLVSYAINSGLVGTFPWLSQIAENFTLYELIGCVFEYRPTSGELGSASNALGKIVMATQYDPDAALFGSAVEMENYAYSETCKPSQHMVHGVETKRSQAATNMLYVRTGPTPKDKIFTDYGIFQVATEGLPVNATAGTIINVGELWVSYRVKLSRPKLFNSLLGASVGKDVLTAWCDGTTSEAANTNAQLPLGNDAPYFNFPTSITQYAIKKNNTIGCTCASTGANSSIITFPSNIIDGTYRIIVTALLPAAGTTTVFATMTSNAFCTFVTQFGYNGLVQQKSPSVLTNTTSIYSIRATVRIQAPGLTQATVGFTNTTNNFPANTQITVLVCEDNSTTIP